jgi:hypothetical protein
MLTVEGDIFPWRYIRASYIKGTWYFMDYIWTEEEKRKYYMLRDDLNPMVQTCIETNWKLNDKK